VNNKPWSSKEDDDLIQKHRIKKSWINDKDFAISLGGERSVDAVRYRIIYLKQQGKINTKEIVSESPYPIYNEPLTMTGDALILPDLEFPFHHSEFVNHVLELSEKWNIKQCILAGDVLHFDSLSGFSPNWEGDNSGGITSDAEKKLMDFAASLGSKKQGELMELMGNLGQHTEQDGASTEIGVARKELLKLEKLFDKCFFILGNHEGRLLKSLDTTLSPDELLRLLDKKNEKWFIAPYYYCYLETEQGRYIIEHPKNFGKFSASKLCSKYGSHVIMAHSHQLVFTFDPSGQYYAIEAGHCVDESRLAYVGQRHNTSPQHCLGAVIVREGFPWLLHNKSDWKALERM
jgi:hypothetical protein